MLRWKIAQNSSKLRKYTLMAKHNHGWKCLMTTQGHAKMLEFWQVSEVGLKKVVIIKASSYYKVNFLTCINITDKLACANHTMILVSQLMSQYDADEAVCHIIVIARIPQNTKLWFVTWPKSLLTVLWLLNMHTSSQSCKSLLITQPVHCIVLLILSTIMILYMSLYFWLIFWFLTLSSI